MSWMVLSDTPLASPIRPTTSSSYDLSSRFYRIFDTELVHAAVIIGLEVYRPLTSGGRLVLLPTAALSFLSQLAA